MLITAVPLVGSAIVWWSARRGEAGRTLAANLVCLLTLLLSLVQFFVVQKGQAIGWSIPWVLAFGLKWRVDHFSAVFALIVSLVWFLATLFSKEYMAHEENQTRFSSPPSSPLAPHGCVLAGDLQPFSLF